MCVVRAGYLDPHHKLGEFWEVQFSSQSFIWKEQTYRGKQKSL